jgi:hypothetical protein
MKLSLKGVWPRKKSDTFYDSHGKWNLLEISAWNRCIDALPTEGK